MMRAINYQEIDAYFVLPEDIETEGMIPSKGNMPSHPNKVQ